jgi:hypothetical protein
MELTPGMKPYGAVSSAQVVVVKAPAEPVDLECAGEPMVGDPPAVPSSASGDEGDLLIGKRYADAERGDRAALHPGRGRTADL